MARLNELMRLAGIWDTYQMEDRTNEGACLDGVFVVLERVSADGYQFSVANARCGASPAYLEAISYIGELAGEQADMLRSWLD